MNKTQLKAKCKSILAAYNPGEFLSEDDFNFMRGLLNGHRDKDIKIGCGVANIFIGVSAFKNKEFRLTRTDGSTEDFSYARCISAPNNRIDFNHACRYAVVDQILDFRRLNFKSGMLCPISGKVLNTIHDVHVDHMDPEFRFIVKDFLNENPWIDINKIEYEDLRESGGFRFKNSLLSDKFADYHKQRANLQIISIASNLKKPKGEVS